MQNTTTEKEQHAFTNHLIDESSPYLLQHAYNPVNWYPWSEEALAKARKEDKPIFLSIGYSACHWCHVMEEESFENEEIARILNKQYISIKVDREQRPDLDQIYMAATIAINGSGGWPMSVFLTPDLKPFFAGTYFPPDDRFGRPGFKRLITQIYRTFKENRQDLESYAQSLTNSLKSSYQSSGASATLDKSIGESTANDLFRTYDKTHGGFGSAPKFPHATDLSFMLKVYSQNKDEKLLSAVEHTLQAMAKGGIYDQLGGGFHRYATDSKWLVPHFEKMLYDNGMLAVTYSEAYQVTKNTFYLKIAEETLDFMINEMWDEKGGFYSSMDADSEGEEGKYYVWKKSEIDNLLGSESEIFSEYYNITSGGNFENRTNILNLNESSDRYKKKSDISKKEFDKLINRQKMKLSNERAKRIRPFTDDKILTSWNGLAISGLSKGYQITGNEKYRKAALKAANFIKDNLIIRGKLHHSFRNGKISSGYFLEDHAYFIQGLINLYETVHDYKWLILARDMASDAVTLFSDDIGTLYLSPDNQEDHFMRPIDFADGALPAPGSILAESLLKLADITGDKTINAQTEKIMTALSSNIKTMPRGMVSAVAAHDYMTSDKIEIILVGKNHRDEFLKEIYDSYLPNRVIIVSEKGDEDIALLEGRKSDGPTVAYICRNFACNLPVKTTDALKRQLAEIKGY